MRQLDFSSPKILMNGVFFRVLISVRGVCGVVVGRMEVGILIVQLGAGGRECEKSVARDIMQVQCVMDNFTLRIHQYY